MKPDHKIVSILVPVVVLCVILTCAVSPPVLQAQTIQVLSANPPSAEQGTVNLNVLIKGKGFKRGALAKFLVTGTTDTGGVRVNSTSYVSATDLTANIDVADTAVLSKFDIQVMNSDGRGGKGTELFTVQKKVVDTFCTPTPILSAPTSCSGGYLGSGCLDTNFGIGGRVITNTSGDIPSTYDFDGANAVAIDSSGRIIVAGVTMENTGGDPMTWPTYPVVLRYLPDGRLDTTFGVGGIVKVIFERSSVRVGQAKAVTIQPDDKILVLGDSDKWVARLKAEDGSLDTSFGTGGKAYAAPGNAYGMALQRDGKIVVIGEEVISNKKSGRLPQTTVWSISRLTANGSLDTGFANGGKLLLNLNGRPNAIAIQQEKIVLGGYTYDLQGGTNSNFTLTRITSTGTMDTSFGSGGVTYTDFCAGFDGINDLVLDSANRIVAVGNGDGSASGGTNAKQNLVLARYSPDGTPDATFGRSGRVMTSIFGNPPPVLDSGRGVALQPDGKIIVSTYSGNSSTMELFVIGRYNPDGTLDTSFGQGGAVATPMGGPSRNLAIQWDGKIVQIGGYEDELNPSLGYYFAVLRYWP